jgi:hypothetical protein
MVTNVLNPYKGSSTRQLWS